MQSGNWKAGDDDDDDEVREQANKRMRRNNKERKEESCTAEITSLMLIEKLKANWKKFTAKIATSRSQLLQH